VRNMRAFPACYNLANNICNVFKIHTSVSSTRSTNLHRDGSKEISLYKGYFLRVSPSLEFQYD
jgi:hypothetical protein